MTKKETIKALRETLDSVGIDFPHRLALVEAIEHLLVPEPAGLNEGTIECIQWTGNNLKDVIDFTGKSPRFGEWFKFWDEFESYVHSHGDILKLFSEDGSHYEVPVGAWIVKTPDGYNVPSVARFVHAKQEQPEVDLEKEAVKFVQSKEFIESKESPVLLTARHFYELGLNARKEK